MRPLPKLLHQKTLLHQEACPKIIKGQAKEVRSLTSVRHGSFCECVDLNKQKVPFRLIYRLEQSVKLWQEIDYYNQVEDLHEHFENTQKLKGEHDNRHFLLIVNAASEYAWQKYHTELIAFSKGTIFEAWGQEMAETAAEFYLKAEKWERTEKRRQWILKWVVEGILKSQNHGETHLGVVDSKTLRANSRGVLSPFVILESQNKWLVAAPLEIFKIANENQPGKLVKGFTDDLNVLETALELTRSGGIYRHFSQAYQAAVSMV